MLSAKMLPVGFAIRKSHLNKFIGMSVLICSLGLSGCATILTGSTDKVQVTSQEPGTEFSYNGIPFAKGESASFELPRGMVASLQGSKAGCETTVITTSQTLNPVTFLNIINLFGFIVDSATGAMFKASPTNYAVTPIRCKVSS
jgi:hypothetical protein